MKIAHVDPYVPNVSVKKQQNKTVGEKNDCGWLRKTKYQLVTMGNYETVYIMAGWWFFALPLWKMMEFGPVGMMTFPISGKSFKNSMVPVTTKQIYEHH